MKERPEILQNQEVQPEEKVNSQIQIMTRLNSVIITSNASGRYTGAVKNILDESIDTDICCMCFTNYEDDVHDGNDTE